MPLGNVPYSARILSFQVSAADSATLTVGIYTQTGTLRATKTEVAVAAGTPEERYEVIVAVLRKCIATVMAEETGNTLDGMLQGMVDKFTNADWTRITN